MKKYVIGIDYGTLSARGILVDSENGDCVCDSLFEYKYSVMDKKFLNGEPLLPLYALQHPKDYLDALKFIVDDLLIKSKVGKENILGLGIDFTSCTVLPVDENNIPLCFDERFKNNPHAYVKLWKHHSAQKYADKINEIAKLRNEKWLKKYGGKISSEWVLPKLYEILVEAPEIFYNTASFVEAGDWLYRLLTSNNAQSAAFAGFKNLWDYDDGFPDNEFFKAVNEKFDGIIGTKISDNILSVDKCAGFIDENGAKLCNLNVKTALSMPMIDAHSVLPSLKITKDNELALILGTSTCHIINSKHKKDIKGICGYVKNGVMPNYFTYEAGQPCVGDSFDWFIKNFVPEKYFIQAKNEGINIHEFLCNKVKDKAPNENDIVALDWLNGNRSIFSNSNLKAGMFGLSLNTKVEDIYKALIESTAFGTKIIINEFEKNDISINSIVATGGIAHKNEMMMQIYADILQKPIKIAPSKLSGALGSAIYASVAAGIYKNIDEASNKMVKGEFKCFYPNRDNKAPYEALYQKYKNLSYDFS